MMPLLPTVAKAAAFLVELGLRRRLGTRVALRLLYAEQECCVCLLRLVSRSTQRPPIRLHVADLSGAREDFLSCQPAMQVLREGGVGAAHRAVFRWKQDIVLPALVQYEQRWISRVVDSWKGWAVWRSASCHSSIQPLVVHAAVDEARVAISSGMDSCQSKLMHPIRCLVSLARCTSHNNLPALPGIKCGS